MSDFKVIETQEQFDEIVKDRIARAENKVAEKYKDYDALKNKVSDYEKQIADLQNAKDDIESDRDKISAQVKALETKNLKIEIARKVGIPYEMADRITGDDEDAMYADAKNMKNYFKPHEAPLGGSGEPNGKKSSNASIDDAWSELARSLDGEEE